MIFFTIDMEKLLKSVRSMIGKSSFKAAALSSFLAVAFLFSSSFALADFRPDVSFSYDSVRDVQAVIDRGNAALVEAALTAVTVDIAVRSASAVAHSDILDVLAYGGNAAPPDYHFLGSLFEYFNRQTIRIRPDSVTIGGVEYSDVWLPHDCADKFRVNAFDFITRYNIASESTGTFVSGAGYLDGIPIFNKNGSFVSQTYIIDFQQGNTPLGNGFVRSTSSVSTAPIAYTDSLGHSHDLSGWFYGTAYPGSFYLRVQGFSSCTSFFKMTGYSETYKAVTFDSSLYDSSSFDFLFVSGTIPIDPLSSTEGLRFRVPSSYVAGLPQILDPSDSSYDSDLSSLVESVTTAGEAGEIADPAFEEWDTPVPPGSGTIADEPYTSLSGALNGIQSVINSISSGVSGIAESIVGADSSFFGNVVSALAVPFEPVFAIFRSGVGIWRYVVSWVGTISAPFAWSLSALGSAGSIFLSPIYAAAAAAVVLAVYKKFGR